MGVNELAFFKEIENRKLRIPAKVFLNLKYVKCSSFKTFASV